MIMEGIFERLPELKVVLIECGFGWLPALGWRLDKHWKRLKDEVPHLKMAPSEYIKKHFWVTTQPMEETENPDHLLEVMNWIGMDRIMFSSDYPHWDFDDPFVSLPPTLDRRAAPQDLLRQRAGAVSAGLMAKKHVVAAVAEIPPGGRKLVTADGRAIVVFNLGGEFFALSNRCPHRGGSLCEGNLTGLVLSDEPGAIQLHPPRRDHPLPLALLGVRHPHRQVLVRSRQGEGAALRRLGGEGGEADRRAVRRRDVPRQRRERLRGGRGVRQPRAALPAASALN